MANGNQHIVELTKMWLGVDAEARERLALCWKGKRARSWVRSVYEDDFPDWAKSLPDDRQDRRQLEDYIASEHHNHRRVAAVLAWGGMFTKNGRLLRPHFDRCAQTVAELSGSRVDWYQALSAMEAPGLGPAYFTKLIRYLRSGGAGDVGFIMDQWLARSINLIFEAEPEGILMHGQGKKYVDRANAAATYGWFCARVEEVAAELNATPELTELFLFASREWRQYLTGKSWHRYAC